MFVLSRTVGQGSGVSPDQESSVDTNQIIMLVMLAVAVVTVGLLTSRRQDTTPVIEDVPVSTETRRERPARRNRQP